MADGPGSVLRLATAEIVELPDTETEMMGSESTIQILTRAMNYARKHRSETCVVLILGEDGYCMSWLGPQDHHERAALYYELGRVMRAIENAGDEPEVEPVGA